MTDRIDLTQFEGKTEGKWEIIDTPNGGIDVGVRHGNAGHSPIITFTQRLANMVRNSSRDVADLNVIAAAPELIAELKRVYELLDEVEYRLEMAENVLGRSDWINVYREWIKGDD